MSQFLAIHIHWLWSLFHTARHPYSPQTLLLFAVVGALQTIVAILGGMLAVEALDTLRGRKKRLTTVFRIIGFMLFVATVWTGLLNDQSQRASDGRADDFKAKLTELSNSVVTGTQLRAEIAKLPGNAPPNTPTQQKLYSQLQQAIDQTNELAKRYSTIPSNSPAPAPLQPSVQVPSAPPAPGIVPQNPNPAPTKASVQAEIEKTLSRLQDTDNTANRSVQATLSGVRSQHIFSGGSNKGTTDDGFLRTVPQLEGILKGRDEAFQRLMPEIIRERSEALALLKTSQYDFAADKAAFDNAIAMSNAKVVIPNSWWQAGNLYTLRYNDMNAYLSTLDQHLKATP
jgi:hypothetical protein